MIEKISTVKKIIIILAIILIASLNAWFLFDFEPVNQQSTNKQTNFIEKIEGFKIRSFDKTQLKYQLNGTTFYKFAKQDDVIIKPIITVFKDKQQDWIIQAQKALLTDNLIKLQNKVQINHSNKQQTMTTAQLHFHPKTQNIYGNKPVFYQTKNLKLSANKMRLDKKILTFYEKVTVTFNDNQTLLASTITIYQKNNQADILIANGSPVTFEQKNTLNPIKASANKITYFTKDNYLALRGDAHFSSDNESLSGHQLDYDLTLKQIQIKGGNENGNVKKRVEINYKL